MGMDNQKEMTLKDFLLLITAWLKYLKGKWFILLTVAVIGAGVGFLRSFFAKPVYKATSTFVLDEEKSSGGGTGLALLGLGGSGGRGEIGLFQGDNLKWLYATRAMVQKSLLTVVEQDGKQILLVDWFLQFDNDALKILKADPSLKTLKFVGTEADSLNSLGPKKNALLNDCYNIIKNKYLKVKDVDKTEGVIEVTITSLNEHFAKNLSDILVENVNKFYIQTKTQKVATQVAKLQEQANEYSKKMNVSMYQTASAIDAVPYANPNQQVNLVQPKLKKVDAEVNSAIYTEIIRNLETSKMDLAQATPLIQVVDTPIYPLPSDKLGLVMNVLLFSLGGFFITALILILRRIYIEAINS